MIGKHKHELAQCKFEVALEYSNVSFLTRTYMRRVENVQIPRQWWLRAVARKACRIESSTKGSRQVSFTT